MTTETDRIGNINQPLLKIKTNKVTIATFSRS